MDAKVRFSCQFSGLGNQFFCWIILWAKLQQLKTFVYICSLISVVLPADLFQWAE
jgi:hypothetical protein